MTPAFTSDARPLSFDEIGIDGNYDHKTVKHSVGEYVDGMAHTNGIESFWALMKRGYNGTYHKIHPSICIDT